MALNYEASSLYSVIRDGKFKGTTAGRSAWKSLISGSSLQLKCNKEGFGIFYKMRNEIRLGFLANNQDKCEKSDSCIGFGMFFDVSCSKETVNITCGNIAVCNKNDNGHKMTVAFGYILVQ